jgi:hypothetical protein
MMNHLYVTDIARALAAAIAQSQGATLPFDVLLSAVQAEYVQSLNEPDREDIDVLKIQQAIRTYLRDVCDQYKTNPDCPHYLFKLHIREIGARTATTSEGNTSGDVASLHQDWSRILSTVVIEEGVDEVSVRLGSESKSIGGDPHNSEGNGSDSGSSTARSTQSHGGSIHSSSLVAFSGVAHSLRAMSSPSSSPSSSSTPSPSSSPSPAEAALGEEFNIWNTQFSDKTSQAIKTSIIAKHESEALRGIDALYYLLNVRHFNILQLESLYNSSNNRTDLRGGNSPHNCPFPTAFKPLTQKHKSCNGPPSFLVGFLPLDPNWYRVSNGIVDNKELVCDDGTRPGVLPASLQDLLTGDPQITLDGDFLKFLYKGDKKTYYRVNLTDIGPEEGTLAVDLNAAENNDYVKCLLMAFSQNHLDCHFKKIQYSTDEGDNFQDFRVLCNEHGHPITGDVDVLAPTIRLSDDNGETTLISAQTNVSEEDGQRLAQYAQYFQDLNDPANDHALNIENVPEGCCEVIERDYMRWAQSEREDKTFKGFLQYEQSHGINAICTEILQGESGVKAIYATIVSTEGIYPYVSSQYYQYCQDKGGNLGDEKLFASFLLNHNVDLGVFKILSDDNAAAAGGGEVKCPDAAAGGEAGGEVVVAEVRPPAGEERRLSQSVFRASIALYSLKNRAKINTEILKAFADKETPFSWIELASAVGVVRRLTTATRNELTTYEKERIVLQIIQHGAECRNIFCPQPFGESIVVLPGHEGMGARIIVCADEKQYLDVWLNDHLGSVLSINPFWMKGDPEDATLFAIPGVTFDSAGWVLLAIKQDIPLTNQQQDYFNAFLDEPDAESRLEAIINGDRITEGVQKVDPPLTVEVIKNDLRTKVQSAVEKHRINRAIRCSMGDGEEGEEKKPATVSNNRDSTRAVAVAAVAAAAPAPAPVPATP